jgi:hypothetical protein
MYTSVALAALMASVAGTSLPASPRWHRDYGLARAEARREGKPLAVFVGSGFQGYTRPSREGRLSPPIQRVLADSYVCVYVDTTNHSGRGLADELEISQGRGLVISDRTGRMQAFSHDGDLTESDLTRYLHRFADPNLVVRTTVTNPEERASYYLPPPPPAPVFFTPAFGGFGGGRSC